MGIDVLAITDHDTMNGLPEAAEAASGTGLTLIPGIELSAQVIDPVPGAIPRSVHLLGYLVDPQMWCLPRRWRRFAPTGMTDSA